MEGEAAEAQEQLSEMGLLVSELRGSLANREKEITTLQTRYTHIHTVLTQRLQNTSPSNHFLCVFVCALGWRKRVFDVLKHSGL